MTIVEPPKIYLDTNHLIEIARLRKGKSVRQGAEEAYLFIDNCITNRHFGVIFSPGASADWVDGHATLESALEIAAVLDSAKLQYQIEADFFVFLYEVQEEIRRLEPSIQLPDFAVMFQRIPGELIRRPLGVLAKQVPDYFDDEDGIDEDVASLTEVRVETIAQQVIDTFKFKKKRPDAYNGRVDGHNAGYLRDVREFRLRASNDKRITTLDFVSWMKRDLRIDRILEGLNRIPDLDALLSQVDRARCPSISLFVGAHEKRVKAGDQPKDNDVDDWASVHVVPYADLTLTERNLRHFICQADPSLTSKVTHDPAEASEMLGQWT